MTHPFIMYLNSVKRVLDTGRGPISPANSNCPVSPDDFDDICVAFNAVLEKLHDRVLSGELKEQLPNFISLCISLHCTHHAFGILEGCIKMIDDLDIGVNSFVSLLDYALKQREDAWKAVTLACTITRCIVGSAEMAEALNTHSILEMVPQSAAMNYALQRLKSLPFEEVSLVGTQYVHSSSITIRYVTDWCVFSEDTISTQMLPFEGVIEVTPSTLLVWRDGRPFAEIRHANCTLVESNVLTMEFVPTEAMEIFQTNGLLEQVSISIDVSERVALFNALERDRVQEPSKWDIISHKPSNVEVESTAPEQTVVSSSEPSGTSVPDTQPVPEKVLHELLDVELIRQLRSQTKALLEGIAQLRTSVLNADEAFLTDFLAKAGELKSLNQIQSWEKSLNSMKS